MKRKRFIKITSLGAFAMSTSGYTMLNESGTFVGDCATTTDYLGPFFREHAPYRNDLSYHSNNDLIALKVVGKVFGADCKKPISDALINVWHCDHHKNYDMDTDEFRCRARLKTNQKGEYWFKTIIPPPYGGRPKHIHYLIKQVTGYQELVTQLYFKGDNKISNRTVMGQKDDRRILDIYKNDQQEAEVRLDLFLSPT